MSEPDEYSTEAARAAAERDELAEWVTEFLASAGSDNPELAESLADPPRWWLGPVQIPLDQLNRLAGPPGAPVLETVPDDEWRDDVDDLAQSIEDDDHEPPPVIATYGDGALKLEDGNHRVEALRRAGVEQAWAIIAFDAPETRDRFVARSSAIADD